MKILKSFTLLSLLMLPQVALACPEDIESISTNLEISALFPAPGQGEFEWVEIHNKESIPVDLALYTLEDSTGHPHTLEGTLNAQSKQRIMELPFQLNNGGDTVILKTSHGDILDTFTYTESQSGEILTKESTSVETASEEEDEEAGHTETPALLPDFSEALPNPEGTDTTEEWIELYNPHSSTLHLEGLYLDDSDGGSSPHALEGSMASHSYKVFDVEDTKLSLNNSTDSIRLLAADKREVLWEIEYASPKESESYALIQGAYQWTDQLTPGEANRSSSSTESAENDGDLSEDLEITEVLPNPEGPDQEGEWIEITNGGTESVDLGNWTLDDGPEGSDPYTFPSGTTIAPGETLIIDRSVSKISLNNSNERIVLSDFTEEIMDDISFDKSIEGKSYTKMRVESVHSTQASASGLGNPTSSTWQWLDPSPGALNPTLKEVTGTVQSMEGSLLTLFDGLQTWEISLNDSATDVLAFEIGNKIKVQILTLEGGGYLLLHSELLETAQTAPVKTQKNFPWTLLTLGLLAASYFGIQEYKKIPKKHLTPILEFKS